MPDTLSATDAEGRCWLIDAEPTGPAGERRLRIEVDGRPSVTVYVDLRPADLPVIADLLLRAAGAPDALERAARSLVYAAHAARRAAAVLESYAGYGDQAPEGRAERERRAAQARCVADALDRQARALGGEAL